MKVIIKDSPQGNEVKFPCLMVANAGDVVWMLKYGCGVSLHHKDWPIGDYSENWAMECFTPFNGTVELSND